MGQVTHLKLEHKLKFLLLLSIYKKVLIKLYN